MTLPALLARSATLLDSICKLKNDLVDAGILSRSLYEHVVTFCWLAIDPQAHLPRWVADDYDERLKMIEHMRSFDDDLAIPADAMPEFKGYVRGVAQRMPNAVDCARAVDKHWGRLLGLDHDGKYSLVGMYAVLFRGYSAVTHPRVVTLQGFVEQQEPGVFYLCRPKREPEYNGVKLLRRFLGPLCLFPTISSDGRGSRAFIKFGVKQPTKGKTMARAATGEIRWASGEPTARIRLGELSS